MFPRRLHLLLFLILPILIVSAGFSSLRHPRAMSDVTPTPVPDVDFDQNLTLTPIPGQDERGFRALVPQGWRDLGEGIFAAADQQTALVQRHIAAPGLRWVLPQLLDDMNLPGDTSPQRRVTRNELEWRIYRGQNENYTLDFALADGAGFLSVYMILLQAHPQDRDVLREAVFLPALDAFQPLS